MISYEDPQALTRKGVSLRELGLGGMMTWELSQNDAANTLLTLMHNGVFANP